MTKLIKDYYKQELNVIESRLNIYTEYGYSSELEPLVDALIEARNKIKAEYKKITATELEAV